MIDKSLRVLRILSHVDCALSINDIHRRKNTRLEPRSEDHNLHYEVIRRPPQIDLGLEEIRDILLREEEKGYIKTSIILNSRCKPHFIAELTPYGRQILRDQGYNPA
jgi:hypothetical protein